jgi:hypothetical protein
VSEVTTNVREEIPKPDPKSDRIPLAKILLELAAVLFWIYAISKLFFFDIDVWVIEKLNPDLIWLLDYKFVFLVAIIAACMLAARSKVVALVIGYMAFYPLLLLFWKFPKFVWKQQSWLLVFVAVNIVISIFQSFKRIFLLAAVALISAVLVFAVEAHAVLYGAILCLLGVLTAIYGRAFLKAFKPSAIFGLYKKLFDEMPSIVAQSLNKELASVPVEKLSETQLATRTTNLQTLVLYNRGCLFVSRRLRDFQKSRLNQISYLTGLIILLLFTVLTFAFINDAAFRIDPRGFQFTNATGTLFGFFYYSTGCLFYASNGMLPLTASTQTIQLVEFFFAIFLLVIIGSVLISTRNQRHTEDLDAVIGVAEATGRTIENLIQSEFQVRDIAGAIESLQTAKAGLVKVIIWLTVGISGDKPQ